MDEVVRVTSAADMFEAVLARFDGCDVFIAAAAVCDYRPVVREEHKIKKTEGRLAVEFERTADILAQMSKRRRRQTLVGFCLETDNLEHAPARNSRSSGWTSWWRTAPRPSTPTARTPSSSPLAARSSGSRT